MATPNDGDSDNINIDCADRNAFIRKEVLSSDVKESEDVQSVTLKETVRCA